MVLKPGQNKKGRKNFQLHRFLNAFSQLPAVKKYSKNGAAGKFFGPSYFDPALHLNWKIIHCMQFFMYIPCTYYRTDARI